MNFIEALSLSVLQGATEFLPVSSSGHLVLAQKLFEGSDFSGTANIAYDVVVHVGTLLSILAVFRKRIVALAGYALGEAWRATSRRGWRAAWLDDDRGRLILAVIVATVPTGIIGLGSEKFLERLFGQPETVGWALCITAALLGATFLRPGTPARNEPAATLDFPLWKALVIGVMQGIAVAPGISRSGSTIAVALLLGLSRPLAGEFSFLMAAPAIAGAALLEFLHRGGASGNLSFGVGAVSLVVAALTGWVFLKLLLRFVRAGQFGWFSVYCLAVGVWAIWRFS